MNNELVLINNDFQELQTDSFLFILIIKSMLFDATKY